MPHGGPGVHDKIGNYNKFRNVLYSAKGHYVLSAFHTVFAFAYWLCCMADNTFLEFGNPLMDNWLGWSHVFA